MKLRLHYKDGAGLYRIVDQVIKTGFANETYWITYDLFASPICGRKKVQWQISHTRFNVSSVLTCPFEFVVDEDIIKPYGRRAFEGKFLSLKDRRNNYHLCFSRDLIFEENDFGWALTHPFQYIRNRAKWQWEKLNGTNSRSMGIVSC